MAGNVSIFIVSCNNSSYTWHWFSSYWLHSELRNNLIITEMNSEGKIKSGIFNLTMISPECNDTLKITEGKFER